MYVYPMTLTDEEIGTTPGAGEYWIKAGGAYGIQNRLRYILEN